MLFHYNSGLIAIVGWHEGGAGQIHAFLKHEGIEIDCFVNDQLAPPHIPNPPKRAARNFSYPTSDSYKGLPLITRPDWPVALHERGVRNILIASSDNKIRQSFILAAQGLLNVLSYVHPTAIILPEAIIEQGGILLAGAVLGYRAEVHAGAILNTAAQVDHNSVVRTCAAIMPGAILCGNVEVGERASVGAGATVVNSIHLGADSFVGAGALVRSNVPSGAVVVGVPATPKKEIAL